jgi:NhaA family Na+:H+ antiporter
MMSNRRRAQLSGAFHEFFQTEAAGGLLLVASAAVALFIANSGWAARYHSLLETTFTIAGGGDGLALTLHEWINDGLMTVFFLHVGLEIKRETIAGELAASRNAMLPIAAACGGMAVPALIYFSLNPSGLAARGWAIPMATDIAFALGTLAIVAPRAPNGLKVFLAALAIADDLGAVIVIALFYGQHIAWAALAKAGVVLVLLVALNLAGIRRVVAYLGLGVLLWFFVHESGVHATIAGVLLAFTVPTKTRINAEEFSRDARALLDEFDRTETGDLLVLTSKGQQDAIFDLERASEAATPPLVTLEHALQSFSAFVVMPLFALSNAGVTFSYATIGSVSVGVILGLVIGKPLGIAAAAIAATKTRLAALPEGVSWPALHGAGCLAGIGFTMSLFIATLAFQGTPLLDQAKLGILAGSVVAGTVGAVITVRYRSGDSRQ